MEMAPRRPPANMDQQPVVRARFKRPRRLLCWPAAAAPLLLLLSLLVLPPAVLGQEAAGKEPFEPVDGACGDEGPWTEVRGPTVGY